MSNESPKPEPQKNTSFWEKTKQVFGEHLGRIALIAGALAILPYLAATFGWFKKLNTVDLPDSFKEEIWKNASVKKFEWLEGEWFYPSLPDFYTRFKIEHEILYQQNEGLNPSPFKTEWIKVKVFISNKGVLRLRYISNDWPGTFIHKQEGKNFEFYNNERYVADGGTVTAGEKRLVLNRDRCKVSPDGITYECR